MPVFVLTKRDFTGKIGVIRNYLSVSELAVLMIGFERYL